MVVGEAGTGKTFAIVAAAEGWAQAGYRAARRAPTWRAANVLRAEGLEATSVARLLTELHGGGARRRARSPRAPCSWSMRPAWSAAPSWRALIQAADAAEAKLVLVGDPAQLGEIEAGGLFRALAERTDPIVLDEVIRHNHDVDREAAKMIREGEDGRRLSLPLRRAGDGRPRRRGAQGGDGRRLAPRLPRGEDALMIAKRNVEVERLNATARELLEAEGQLGAQEIEVGEARFAAGDQVITRVNDHAERHLQPRALAGGRGRRRAGASSSRDRPARTVEVGPDYLSRNNPPGDAPALQHAYAVTTYCAQGTTVDRAYVMADLRWTTGALRRHSRSREETYLYATPEIQAERAEYAPEPPERDAIGHVAKPRSATAPRRRPTRRRCAQSFAGCRLGRSSPGRGRSPARPRGRGGSGDCAPNSRAASSMRRAP